MLKAVRQDGRDVTDEPLELQAANVCPESR
jgi:hypothetical protein